MSTGPISQKALLTLLDLLDGTDHIIEEILQVTNRVGDAGCLVDLRQGRIENRDDIFEKFRSDALFFGECPFETAKRCAHLED